MASPQPLLVSTFFFVTTIFFVLLAVKLPSSSCEAATTPLFHFSAENTSSLNLEQVSCVVDTWANMGSFGGIARPLLNSEYPPNSAVIPTKPKLVQYAATSHLGFYLDGTASLVMDLGSYTPSNPLQIFIAMANAPGLTSTNFLMGFVPKSSMGLRPNAGAGIFFQVSDLYYLMDGTSAYYPDGYSPYALGPTTVKQITSRFLHFS